MTDIILDEVVDSVFEELEAALGKFRSDHRCQTTSGRPLDNGLSVLVAQSYSGFLTKLWFQFSVIWPLKNTNLKLTQNSDDYVDEVYDGEVNAEIPDESNAISILSNENSFQQNSSIMNSTQISSEISAAR